MISVKSLARCALMPDTFALWKNLVLQVRPDLAGTSNPHSVKSALSGFTCINISGVPDLDQQWSALPNTGKMYCQPTAAMNWMMYLAQNSYPSADSPSDPIPGRLQLMADYMDTDPDCGTDYDDAVEGIADWLDDRNIPLVVAGLDFNEDVPVLFDDLDNTVRFGGLVNLRIGYYDPVDDGFERDGGHAVTLTGLDEAAGQRALHVHNPNNDEVNLTTQSPTQTLRVPVAAVHVTLDGETGWVLRYTENKFLVGFITILPVYAVADASLSTVAVYSASWDGASVSTKIFDVPFSGPVVDIALHPSRPAASVLDAQSGAIWNLDLGRGTWRPFATVAGASRLAYHGRANALVAFGRNSLTALDSEGRSAQQIALDVVIDDAIHDFRSGMLLAASSNSEHVLCFSSDLRSRIELADRVPRGSGRVQLSLDARRRHLTVSRSDSPDIIATVLPWGQRERHRASRIAPHDDSRPVRYTIQRGELVGQRADGTRLESAAMNGIRGRSIIRIAQTSHNVNPRHTGTRRWRDQ
jgi:hypothetical protein